MELVPTASAGASSSSSDNTSPPADRLKQARVGREDSFTRDCKCWSCLLARDTSRSFAEISRVGACLLGGGCMSRSLLAGGHVCRNLLAEESGRPANREAVIDRRVAACVCGSQRVEGRWVQNFKIQIACWPACVGDGRVGGHWANVHV
uniref:Uncharacterized protein n=2 Tax=Setaria TaxID=4554 RepID=K3ZXS3_SETIT|nr:hypothetical protein SEVIR_2G242266v2 [Setaria viridis]